MLKKDTENVMDGEIKQRESIKEKENTKKQLHSERGSRKFLMRKRRLENSALNWYIEDMRD